VGRDGTPREGEAGAVFADDLNMTIAAWLNALAAVQDSKQREFGYKQAASAIRWLDEPIEDLRLPDGNLRRIPRIGPASTRVILEVLETGTSPTVEPAMALSPRAPEVAKRRQWRSHFLSRARVRRVLADRSLPGPDLPDYRGDLQMHSTWSDGSQSLEDIVETGIARGYAFAAVTDHAGSLAIANGLSPERFARQHAEIDALNQRVPAGFRFLKGVEANIGADGRLDVDAQALRQFDVVLAREAVDAGCLFALDSDAHSVREWSYAGHRRRARPVGRRAGRARDRLLAAGQAGRMAERTCRIVARSMLFNPSSGWG
jgi:hypothetical protein